MTDSRRFYLTDPHFGHRLVAHHRGFGDSRETADPDAHDALIVSNYRAAGITAIDEVFWAGDLVGINRNYRHALSIIADLPGRHRLIAGNHDVVSPIHKNSGQYQREYLEVFESVEAYAVVHFNLPVRRPDISGKREVMLSHYPYIGNEDDHSSDARYTQFRLPDEGRWLLHGHTHMPHQRLHFTTAGTPQIHVGLDAWDLKPVPESTLIDIMFRHEFPADAAALDAGNRVGNDHTNGA